MKTIKYFVIALALTALAVVATACEPLLCEDCYNVTQNGETTYVCVEYSCRNVPNVSQ